MTILGQGLLTSQRNGASSAEVVSNLSTIVDSLSSNQLLLGYRVVLNDTKSFLNFTQLVDNDFKDTLQIDAVASQNYLHNTPANTISALAGGLVPQSIGTPQGQYVLNAPGNSLLFDGNKNQTSATGGESPNVNGTQSIWAGKDWGAGNDKIITQAQCWGSTDNGFSLSTLSNTLKLFGSTGATGVSQQIPAGTIVELGSITFNDIAGQTVQTVIATDTSTAYRYHWVESTVASGGLVTRLMAELEFTEKINTPFILQSIPQLFSSAPSSVKLTVAIIETDQVTENTDLTAEVSRDGGVTFDTVILDVIATPAVGFGKLLSGVSNISLQPTGQDMVWRLTGTNFKRFDVVFVGIQGL